LTIRKEIYLCLQIYHFIKNNFTLSLLSKQKLPSAQNIDVPVENIFSLPEKVLQFGTGVLLRALPDFFIDKANKKGIFNGRIIVVKSMEGSSDYFSRQDNLYTTIIKGIENGKVTEETIINASVSRVLTAKEDWNEILKCAYNKDLQIIISNTTEVGIVLTEDQITNAPPGSFPGKLLAFLYERFKAFNGSEESGMIIIPTELITDNGSVLRDIVITLAKQNNLEPEFIEWIQNDNHFCNSLVDRIVPGRLPAEEHKATEKTLGYEDNLMIMAEPFRLWAIETKSEKVKDILSFAQADEGVILTKDIHKFKELKLRLLNGTHTLSCALAMLSGFITVKEAMNDKAFFNFVHRLIFDELAVATATNGISLEEANAFSAKVLDRFRNPFLEHKWNSIALNYTSKIKARDIPLLKKYYAVKNKAPQHFALGFAAYLLFMKTEYSAGKYVKNLHEKEYILQDEEAGYLYNLWQENNAQTIVNAVFKNNRLWGEDLTQYENFAETVSLFLHSLSETGAQKTIENLINKTNK
jgi:tagaturonate reductase